MLPCENKTPFKAWLNKISHRSFPKRELIDRQDRHTVFPPRNRFRNYIILTTKQQWKSKERLSVADVFPLQPLQDCSFFWGTILWAICAQVYFLWTFSFGVTSPYQACGLPYYASYVEIEKRSLELQTKSHSDTSFSCRRTAAIVCLHGSMARALFSRCWLLFKGLIKLYILQIFDSLNAKSWSFTI